MLIPPPGGPRRAGLLVLRGLRRSWSRRRHRDRGLPPLMSRRSITADSGAALTELYHFGWIGFRPRDADEFGRMAFPRLELAQPGVVLVSEWRPAEDGLTPPAATGGEGRKA